MKASARLTVTQPRPIRSPHLALLLLLCPLSVPAEAEVAVRGFVAARASGTNAPVSWIDAAFGRLLGGDGDGASAALGGETRVEISYTASSSWSARVHLGARADQHSKGRNLGVVEAFIDRRWAFDESRVQLRLGQFFLPTSLENIDPLWVSPYTLTHSALNSWMGEEFRPLGADLRLRRNLTSGNQIDLGITAFQNNDASGALLAWRGFALHDRVSYFGETLPLPPLASLSDPTIFGEQNAAGSKPFGSDLDGRTGFAARSRFSSDRSLWQLSAVSTRGDRNLYRGEYSWQTRFLTAGWEYNALGEGWGHAAELMHGNTRMGPTGRPNANIDMTTGYWLASFGADPWRYSVRVEAFAIDDIDKSIAEINDERGRALTLAALRQFEQWRVGIEYLCLDSERPAAAAEGEPPQAGGHQLKLEARYVF